MANEEEMELEPVIKRTEATSRVDGRNKSNILIRVAKLTGRTISSLRNQIKEKRLDRAYDKYNKTYGKMRRALKEANTVKAEYTNNKSVSQSEVFEAYDIVDSYGKKLAKLGVKLLDEDIKRVAASKKAKPIRVPRILVGRMGKILRAAIKAKEKRRDKKLQKETAKEMKAATGDFIQNSLDSALFKDNDASVLRSVINKETIKDLGLGKTGNSLDGLRKFISEDGVTSALSDEELGRVEKPVTDVPPVEPTPSVEKVAPVVSEEDILGDLSEKSAPVIEESSAVTQPRVTLDDLTAGLNVEKNNSVPVNEHPVEENITIKEDSAPITTSQEPTVQLSDEEKQLIARRKYEIGTIISLGNSIAALEKQAEKINSQETKKMIQGYIDNLNVQLDQIISNSVVPNKKDEVVDEHQVEKESDLELTSEKEAETENNQSMEPITVAAASEESEKGESPVEQSREEEPEYEIKYYADGEIAKVPVKKDNLEGVKIIEGLPADRAVQEDAPKAVRVEPNFQDILSRNTNARQAEENSMSQLEELKRERDLLLQKLEEDSLAREQRAQETKKEQDAIASQISEIRSFAEENGVDLGGRSK